MKKSLDKEIFWKVMIWRFLISIPLSMIINYFYYQSISAVISLTIVSNITGYIFHYLFEVNWPKIWNLILKITDYLK